MVVRSVKSLFVYGWHQVIFQTQALKVLRVIKRADFDGGRNQKWINGQDHLEKTNTFKTFGLFTKKQKQIKGMKYYSIFMKVAPHGYRHHRNNWVNCHFRQNILLDIFYIGSHQQSKGVLTLPDLCYFFNSFNKNMKSVRNSAHRSTNTKSISIPTEITKV